MTQVPVADDLIAFPFWSAPGTDFITLAWFICLVLSSIILLGLRLPVTRLDPGVASMSIRALGGRLVRSFVPSAWSQRSYSQEGEDLIVGRLLGNLNTGFYVDVGSHHPFRFSNTYLLYRRGWRGLCIDPLPGSSALFRRWRRRDIAIEMGVSSESSTLDYYMFNDPALNSFDVELSQQRDGIRNYRITGVRKVYTDTLATIMKRFIPADVANIDMMSVDVEGLDLQVLESNDWDMYRPSVLIAECLGTDLGALAEDATVRFLADRGYKMHAKTGQSVIFTGNI